MKSKIQPLNSYALDLIAAFGIVSKVFEAYGQPATELMRRAIVTADEARNTPRFVVLMGKKLDEIQAAIDDEKRATRRGGAR